MGRGIVRRPGAAKLALAMNRAPKTLRSVSPGLLPVALLVLTAALGCGAGAETSAASVERRPVPEFRLATLDGGEVTRSDYAGKVLLLDFWATWCTPCRAQARILEAVYEDVQGDGVEFLAVDSGEDPELVREFAAGSPFPYPVVLDADEALSLELDVIILPTVVIVDREGRISYLREGIADGATLREELQRAGASGIPADSTEP